MSSSNRPSFLSTLLVDTSVYFGGAVLGLGMAIATAPGSGVAYFLGFSMLPMAFLLGRSLWESLGELRTIYRCLLRIFSTRARREKNHPRPDQQIPSGSIVLVPISLASTTLAGAITARFFLPTETDMGAVIFRYALLGLIYGGLCWFLIRSGYLQQEDGVE